MIIGDKTSYVVYLAMLFSLVSAIISVIAFFVSKTSILSNEDMQLLKESCIIKNYSALEDQPLTKEERDLSKIEEEFDRRLSWIKQMPRCTPDQCDLYERRMTSFKIDYEHALGEYKDNAQLSLSDEDSEYLEEHEDTKGKFLEDYWI